MAKSNKRRNARETAFKMLFQMDVGGNSPEIASETMNEALAEGLFPESECGYITSVTQGVREKLEEADAFISEHARGWTIDRINPMDKNIIRLAYYEIKYMDSIPYEVSLNEAVELAKRYGEDNSYSFVNGILDCLKAEKAEAEGKQ